MKSAAMWSFLLFVTVALGVQGPQAVRAQDRPATEAAPVKEDQQALYDKFEKMMAGAKLVGQFSIVGRDDDKLRNEEYTINKVKKLDRGDYWSFEARIKYGDNDYTVPIPLEVKWAGDTPMVTLTDLTILGQGPFSARVLFYNDKYAGTWSHGEVHGHLFGTIHRDEKSKD